MTRKIYRQVPYSTEEFSEAARKGHQIVNITEREDVEFHVGTLIDELAEKYNLTRAQQNFLLWRLRFQTDSACARSIGMSPNTIKRWKHDKQHEAEGRDLGFLPAYEALLARYREVAEASMASLGPRAVEVTAQLLRATKKQVVSTGEGVEPKIIETPDYENRFRGVQIVSNWLGEWGQKPVAPQNTNYFVVMEKFQELLAEKQRQLALTAGTVVDSEAKILEEDRYVTTTSG